LEGLRGRLAHQLFGFVGEAGASAGFFAAGLAVAGLAAADGSAASPAALARTGVSPFFGAAAFSAFGLTGAAAIASSGTFDGGPVNTRIGGIDGGRSASRLCFAGLPFAADWPAAAGGVSSSSSSSMSDSAAGRVRLRVHITSRI
jgi:hypothetical protein